MKTIDAYLQITPRMAAGASRTINAASTAMGKQAGDATVKAYQERAQRVRDSTGRFISDGQRQATQAGQKVGKGAGDATVQAYRDAAGRLRGAGGRFLADGERETKQAAERGGRSAGNAFGMGLRSTLGPLRLFGGAVIGGIVAQIGEKAASMGIKTAASIEQARIAFTTLTGSATTANQEIKDLQEFAAKTPFEFPGLIHDANLLQGVGVQAKSIIPIMTAWGDAAGALGVDNEHFNNIMMALSQSIGAGKINAQDMLQITENGIPIWTIMAKALHKPVSEIRDMSQAGELLASDVLPAVQAEMAKDYGGNMAKQSKTLTGVWSNLMDSLNTGLANSLQPIIPTLTSLIPKATGFFTTALRGVSGALGGFMSGLHGAGGEVHGVAKVFWEIAQAVLSFYYSVKSGKADVNDIYGVIGGLGAIIHNLAVWVINASKSAWPILVAVIKQAYDAFKRIEPTIIAVTGFLARHATAIQRVAIAALALVVAFKAYNAAMTAGRAIMVAYTVAMNVVKGVTGAWTAIQWLLNIAMDANPIGLVILAIAALVIAIIAVIKWHKQILAFFKFVWGYIWNFMKMIGAWFAGPFVAFFVGVGKAIAAPFLWFYNQVIKPVFGFIVNLIRTDIAIVKNIIGGILNFFHPVFVAVGIVVSIFAKIFEVAFGVVRIAIKLVQDSIRGWVLIFTWAFNMVKAGALAVWAWVWAHFMSPIIAGAKMVGSWFSALWTNYISPALANIKAGALAAWNWVWAHFISPIIGGVKMVGAWFSALWTNYVSPAWNNFMSGLSKGWNWVKTNVFDRIANIITKDIPGAFNKGVGFIGSAWDKVKDAAKLPVKFIVNTVLNNGIIDGFNWIAGKVGVSKIDHLKLPKGFADGGPVTGYTGSGGKYQPAGLVHGGEYVLTRQQTSRIGVSNLNQVFGGRGDGVRRGGDLSSGMSLGFADGGFVGWLKGAFSTLTNPGKAIGDQVNKLLGDVPGSGVVKDLAVGVVHKLTGGLANFVGKHLSAGNEGNYSGPVSGNVREAQDFIKAQNHKPYIWAGSGSNGTDCSGFVSWVYNFLTGRQPVFGHTFSTSNEAGYFPKKAWSGPLTAGWSNPGERGGGDVGHTAGNLAGLAFESGGAGGDMHYGKGSTNVTSFAHLGSFARGGLVPRLFDHGGILAPGQLAANLSGKPEMVRSAAEERAIEDKLDELIKVTRARKPGEEHYHFEDRSDVDAFVQKMVAVRGLG